MRILILSVCIFIYVINLEAQTKPSKWNFSYKYDVNSLVKCQYRLWELKDSVVVFFKLTFDEKYAKEKQFHKKYTWAFDVKITSSYDTKNTLLEGTFSSNKYQIAENEYLFSVQIPKITESSAYLFLAYFQDESGKILIEDIPLKIVGTELYSENLAFYYKTEVPVFENFISKSDTFSIKSGFGNSKTSIHYFKYNFAAALPPMATVNTGDQDVRLSPDSTLVVDCDSMIIPFKKGFYMLPSINKNKSNRLMVIENRFPKVTKTRELIDPCIYIATDDERKGMKQSQKPKVKLDDFWLSLGQDKDFARKMIKNYYTKVQEANALFTLYKEGWKTDMGMIYIVFGKPDYVYKQDLKETWKYKSRPNIPSVNFIFNKKSGPLGCFFYELQNSDDYANVWYNTVELWRKGMIEK